MPDGVELKEGDLVTAVQNEPDRGKGPSDPAQETVGGGDVDNGEKSDTPDINPIYEGDRVVAGNGTPGSRITVKFPNGTEVSATVNGDGTWSVNVPANLDLEVGDVVLAQQKTGDKDPSDWARSTVREKPAEDVSDTPNIDPIAVGDDKVTGQGVPGAEIIVKWPDDSTTKTTVDEDGNWSVDIPDDVTLVAGDIVEAVQKETGKLPSNPAQETVGGGDFPNNQRSDTPDVDVIYEGERTVTGRGTPGSLIEVRFPGGQVVTTTVGEDSKWSVGVPQGVSLAAGDLVFARQTTDPKSPSRWARNTVRPLTKSEKPIINPIKEGDSTVTGKGVPGAEIEVTWPGGGKSTTTVGGDGTWSVKVPDNVKLKKDDTVRAVQTERERGKGPSDPVTATVGAADAPGESSQPKVDPVTEGDRRITGEGVPDSEIIITWPDGSDSKGKVDPDGKWSVDVPDGIDLGPGDRISVVQVEKGKSPSAPVVVIVARRASSTPGQGGTSRPGGSGLPPAQRPAEKMADEPAPLAGFIADHIRYILGYPDGSVKPDTPITRAETAEIIFRLLEASKNKYPYDSKFPDVGPDDWYTQSVTYLASIGIIRGYPDGTFKPDRSITRAEFATMISGFDKLEQADYNVFPDLYGHWAAGYINSAATKGWVSGYLDGEFKPENEITRAEVVSVINRMLNRRIEFKDIPDWAPGFTDLPPRDRHWAYEAIIEASIGHKYQRKPNGSEIWTEVLK